jgi:hypothetical protein
MALLFTTVPPVGTYSLYQGVGSALGITIFLDVPFADLPHYGEDAPTVSRQEEDKLTFKAPPQLALHDPLLSGDPDAWRLDDARYLALPTYQSTKPLPDSRVA